MKLGREVSEMPCDVYFDEPEWKALAVCITENPITPEKPPSLGEAVRMVAKLGGFLGRKSDGEPGAECLWRGFDKLYYVVRMWLIMNGRTSGDLDSPLT